MLGYCTSASGRVLQPQCQGTAPPVPVGRVLHPQCQYPITVRWYCPGSSAAQCCATHGPRRPSRLLQVHLPSWRLPARAAPTPRGALAPARPVQLLLHSLTQGAPGALLLLLFLLLLFFYLFRFIFLFLLSAALAFAHGAPSALLLLL